MLNIKKTNNLTGVNMKHIKLKIFLNLKNFYELSFEIKQEKDADMKAMKQQIARSVYAKLNNLFVMYKPIWREMNALFKNVKSLEDVKAVKWERANG
tara:strand:- start:93 stop:383 length:291 start_codon:yes stop_codon:yes gene_type:complete